MGAQRRALGQLHTFLVLNDPFLAGRRQITVCQAFGPVRGTEVAALFYSLIESAKLVGVDPSDYLLQATRAALAATKSRGRTSSADRSAVRTERTRSGLRPRLHLSASHGAFRKRETPMIFWIIGVLSWTSQEMTAA